MSIDLTSSMSRAVRSAIRWSLPLLALPGLAAAITGDPVPQTIFNGSSLDGWEGDPKHWRLENGAITGEIPEGGSLASNQWIYWKDEVHDFDFETEFRISGGPTANSGIQFRCQRDGKGVASGYQADLDSGAEWLGRIYDEHGRALITERGKRVSIAPDGRRWEDEFAAAAGFRSLLKPGDAWNTYRVTAWASHVEVRVNGVLCAVLDDHQTNAAEFSGRLAFQLHSGPGPAKVEFRNIRLTNLGRSVLPERSKAAAAPDAEENPPIKATGADGKVLNLDFEAGTLEDWTAEGNVWERQPVSGDTVTPRKPGEASRHAGKFWIGSYEVFGDARTGTLTSAPFEVKHPWAGFLIGAGSDPKLARMEIISADDGTVLQTFSGRDVEDMRREAADLRSIAGRKIAIRLVDNGTGGWGHINFDDFAFYAKEPVRSAAGGATGDRGHDSPVLWHLGANPAPPAALGSESARKLVADMRLVQGFQAELLASEPEVVQPVAFSIDDRGRLWIAEALSYPNKQPDGQGKDRIIILADEDGNGSFESRKIFADGLNLVSGIETGFGGVFVGAAPELLFIPDRNGDDKPDGKPEVLLDGWGYQDTHETLNSFTWGPDGWLYGCQGVFTSSRPGVPGTPDDQRADFRAGIWRWHPVRRKFEVFAIGGSNQWGIDFNDIGHLFITHCRSFYGGGGTTYVIRNGNYWNQADSNHAPFIASRPPADLPELKNYLLSSARYDSGEGGAGKPGTTAVYGGHSHVGTMIYLGDNWPSIYRNHLFTHNLHGHQINHQHNVRDGSGWETFHAGYDISHVPDPTYIGVDLQYGPDGAMYSIDWTDQQHCHTPSPEKWDRSNGRVYRVSWAETYKPVKVNLGAMSDAELVALHTHRNEWQVRTARRMLQSRAADGKLETAAVTTALQQAFDGAQDEVSALRPLWTLHVIGQTDEALLQKAMASKFESVRAWGVHLATERKPVGSSLAERIWNLAKDDSSSMVRLAAASALPALDDEWRWMTATALAAHAEDAGDRWLPDLIWQGIAPLTRRDPVRALSIAASTPMRTLADSILWFAARTPDGRTALAQEFTIKDKDYAARGLRLMAAGMDNESAPVPDRWSLVTERFDSDRDPALRDAIDRLSFAFGDKVVFTRLLGVLADEQAPLPQRRRAFDLIRRTDDPAAQPVYAKLLGNRAFRSAVIPLVARGGDASTAALLLAGFESSTPADRDALLAALTSRPVMAAALLEAVKAKKFERKNLNALHIRQMKNLNDEGVTRSLQEVWGTIGETSGNAKESIAKWKKKYSEAPLWAYEASAGQQVFTKVCAACHLMNGTGGRIGPDMSGTWRNGVDYFLENIIDPNAVVGEDFQLHIITRKDGTVAGGQLESETDTAITVRMATESVTVAKADIKDHQKTTQSLMPPGLLETLTEREVIELLKFLSTKSD